MDVNPLKFKVTTNFIFFLYQENIFRNKGFLPIKTKLNQNSNKTHSRFTVFKEKIKLKYLNGSTSKVFKILCFDITVVLTNFL
jgi:hypothetical protein